MIDKIKNKIRRIPARRKKIIVGIFSSIYLLSVSGEFLGGQFEMKKFLTQAFYASPLTALSLTFMLVMSFGLLKEVNHEAGEMVESKQEGVGKIKKYLPIVIGITAGVAVLIERTLLKVY